MVPPWYLSGYIIPIILKDTSDGSQKNNLNGSQHVYVHITLPHGFIIITHAGHIILKV